MDTETASTTLHLDRRWRLAEQVAIRPEAFGALAYHFGTRRLSFLKDRTLVAIVTSLDGSRTGRQVFRAVGVDEDQQPRYSRALASLVASGMIVANDEPAGPDADTRTTEETLNPS